MLITWRLEESSSLGDRQGDSSIVGDGVGDSLLIGDGDGDVLVIPEGSAHRGYTLHQACHHRCASRRPQLHSVPHHKRP